MELDLFQGTGWQGLERLGAGTSGQVWKVRRESDGLVAAAKLLRPDLAENPEVLKRFVQESNLVTGIRHPNVVAVYAMQQIPGGLAIFMEYLDGGDLEGLLRRQGTLTPREAISCLQQITYGLGAIHQAGIVHRDLKPSNIMLQRQGDSLVPKLADFGLARWIDPEQDAQTTKRSGTPYYMAPEMIEGQGVSAKTDLYSVGVILYQMLSGIQPFKGSIAQVLGHQFHDLPGKIPGLAPEMWNLISQLMAKEPSVRPDAAELLRVLEALAPVVKNYPALPALTVPPPVIPLQNVVHHFPGGAATALDSVRPLVLSSEEKKLKSDQTSRGIRSLVWGAYSFRNAPLIWILGIADIILLAFLTFLLL